MEFTFKDKASKELFENRNESFDTLKDEPNVGEEASYDIYQEDFINIEKFVKVQEIKVKKEIVLDIENVEDKNLETKEVIDIEGLNTIKSTVRRIDSKQNVILEILEKISLPTLNQVQIKQIKEDELDLLNFNLTSFNTKLITLSITSKNIEIKELLLLLSQISDHILSNSFYIFTLDKSPVKKALNNIDRLGMDKKINKSILETEILLHKIDNIASKGVFEQNYYYSNFLLEKGLLLQSIILLNEAISIYIVEAIKNFSKPINKYTCLIGEENRPKLYSQAKDFFIFLFSINENKDKKENIIPLFPHHKFVKDIDTEIAYKFNKLYTTWKHKGDVGLFEKYAYIIDRVRRIRNNLAHGNMEIDFYDLKKEMFELIKDFEYLSIKKNIFKYKTRK